MKSDDHWTDAVVDGIEQLSPSVRGLRLRPAVGVRPWRVGSHLRVQVRIAGRHAGAGDNAGAGAGDHAGGGDNAAAGDERQDVRSYSLVGLPGDSTRDGSYRIAVKRAEQSRGGSDFMWRLQPGDALPMAGPDNHFELPARAPHTLLVAGGIGITPILGMALTLAGRGESLRMCYAARQPDELVFADVLQAALGQRLQTYVASSNQRIDLDAEIAALPPHARMLICGPVPLLQATQAAWQRAQRPAAALRFETFGSSGHLPAEPFWVKLPRHGLELQVPADRSLLEVLDAHGVQTLYDCQRGECGLCAVDVISVQGTVDHRDVFFSAEEKRGNHRLCACVSRVCGGGVVIDSAWRPDALPATA